MEPLKVTPDDLRAASAYLGFVSARMKDVHTSLLEMLGGEGQAWGNDKIGKQFESGAQGYRAQSDWIDGSIGAKTDLLDYYADGLKIIADALELQDSAWG